MLRSRVFICFGWTPRYLGVGAGGDDLEGLGANALHLDWMDVDHGPSRAANRESWDCEMNCRMTILSSLSGTVIDTPDRSDTTIISPSG